MKWPYRNATKRMERFANDHDVQFTFQSERDKIKWIALVVTGDPLLAHKALSRISQCTLSLGLPVHFYVVVRLLRRTRRHGQGDLLPEIRHKRIYRVYREAGLCIRRKKRKHCARIGQPLRRCTAANQEWAFDFVHDAIAAGRAIRVLSVVDAFTRECLALEVDTSFASRRVTRVLEEIVVERGLPQSIRCDNGPEMTSRHFLAWCLEKKIELVHIQPGKPTQNGRVESFNGRLREELLRVSWFENLFDARRKISEWRKDCNEQRPHSSLGYRTPKEFAATAKAKDLYTTKAEEGASNASPFPHTPIPAQTEDGMELECRMLKRAE